MRAQDLGRGVSANPNTGEPIAGPETLSEEELARNRADVEADILAHPLDDEYYRGNRRSGPRSRCRCSRRRTGAGRGFTPGATSRVSVRAASEEKWLEVHGGEHWTEFYTRYGVSLQKRFFEHFLKGIDNGWKDRPRVQLQVRTVKGFVQRDGA